MLRWRRRQLKMTQLYILLKTGLEHQNPAISGKRGALRRFEAWGGLCGCLGCDTIIYTTELVAVLFSRFVSLKGTFDFGAHLSQNDCNAQEGTISVSQSLLPAALTPIFAHRLLPNVVFPGINSRTDVSEG